MCENAENNLEIKKKESKIKRMQEERLRVSSENQLQLFDEVIIDQSEQLQKVVDSLLFMQRQQN